MTKTERVTSSSDDGVYTVTGTGDLDLYVVEPFSQALSDAAVSGGQIVVDFRQASFIDTSFVVALVRPAKKMLEQGGRLKVLVTEGAYPQYVLKTIGLGEFADIVAEESSATMERQS